MDDDIVAMGGDLSPETLISAYRNGVFPWPVEGLPLLWFCPRERAILEFDRVHVGRSLARAEKRAGFDVSIDRAFDAVIRACAAAPRPGQEGTWITQDVVRAYCRLHRLGFAHSVEVWRDGDLAGGVYGVAIEGTFSAESMFHHQPNASKIALLHLVDRLRGCGLDWLDIQVLTPHMERLGARAIPREAFLDRLATTQRRRLQLF